MIQYILLIASRTSIGPKIHIVVLVVCFSSFGEWLLPWLSSYDHTTMRDWK